jgi:hypothetical protein
MAYAESMGIAAMLDKLSQGLGIISQRQINQDDILRKLEVERTNKLIDSNRLMYQPTAPVNDKLSLSGEPTNEMGINSAIQKLYPSPLTDTPAPALPKPQPLSIQQQYELNKSIMKGKGIDSKYTTIPEKLPDESTLTKTIVEDGKTRKEYDVLGTKKADIAAKNKEAYINYQSNVARTTNPKYKALAELQNVYYKQVSDYALPEADRRSAQENLDIINDQLKEIAGMPTSKAPIKNPAENNVKPEPKYKVGDPTSKGTITSVTWDDTAKKYIYEVK